MTPTFFKVETGKDSKSIGLSAINDAKFFGPAFGDNDGNTLTEHQAYQRVAWVRRCVEIRANALSAIPFKVYKGKVEQEGWPYKDAMPGLLWITEASLQLYGASYLERLSNVFGIGKGFKWLLPSTITPKYSAEQGLVSFERRLRGGATIPLKIDDVVYFWNQSLETEVGPGSGWVGTALSAAGIVYNADAFASGFFEHGAILTTLLSVEGQPPDRELRALEAWWKRLVNGVKSAGETVAVKASVKPVVVGVKPDELAMPELITLSREDICTAAGVPQTMLSMSANYATAVEDHRGLYTSTLVPEAILIKGALNEQYFRPLGLECDLDWQSLDIFQEDEADRSAALKQMTDAGVPLDLAMEMLGMELPGQMTYDDLRTRIDEDKAKATPVQLQPFTGQQQPPTQQAEAQPPRAVSEDMDRWRRKALSSLKAGNVADVPFVSGVIPDADAAVVHERLVKATDADEVRAAFEPPFCCVTHEHAEKAEPYLVIDGEPLPPIETVRITQDDIKRAFAEWNRIMPSEYTDLLDAGVED
jgi:HK97 family phage portal protein